MRRPYWNVVSLVFDPQDHRAERTIMPEYKAHEPGTFCYAELATSDTAVAGEFYMSLFGWNRNDQDLGEFGVYTQFDLDGKVVAAQFKLTDEQLANNVPPNWGQYVSVADVDASAAKATELGGQTVMGPMDVLDYGRMVVLADPIGAVFCLWQPQGNIGVTFKDDPGSMCWNELLTSDTAQASEFYGGLFGWTPQTMNMGEMGDYTMFGSGGDRPAGGMMPIQPDMGPIPPHWLVYFAVADCNAAQEKAAGLGATILVPPTEIPKMGMFSVLQDPAGAVFGIYQSLR
jgi:predicted enzyme related to lactoylglutathione lyase